MTFEIGARMAVHQLNREYDSPKTEETVHSLWVCERSNTCVAEMMALKEDHQPDHIFKNYNDFLNPEVLEKLAGLNPMAKNFPEKKQEIILGSPTKTRVKCIKTSSMVDVERAHVHAAGTPCVHDSVYGKKEKQHGRHSYLFLIFIRQRMDLCEPWWVSENVVGHSPEPYRTFLKDLYDVEVIYTDPAKEGWSISRRRAYIVGRLKALSPRIWKNVTTLDEIYHAILERKCKHGASHYFVANDAEKLRDWTRAKVRKTVMKERPSHPERGITDSWDHCLTVNEFKRLEKYSKLAPGQFCDLGQDPVTDCPETPTPTPKNRRRFLRGCMRYARTVGKNHPGHDVRTGGQARARTRTAWPRLYLGARRNSRKTLCPTGQRKFQKRNFRFSKPKLSDFKTDAGRMRK